MVAENVSHERGNFDLLSWLRNVDFSVPEVCGGIVSLGGAGIRIVTGVKGFRLTRSKHRCADLYWMVLKYEELWHHPDFCGARVFGRTTRMSWSSI